MIRVSLTASGNLPGTCSIQGPGVRPGLAEDYASRQRPPTMRTIAVATKWPTRRSRFPLVVKYPVNVGINAEERAPSANRSRVRFGIRNPTTNASLIGCHEQARDHHFANQTGEPA